MKAPSWLLYATVIGTMVLGIFFGVGGGTQYHQGPTPSIEKEADGFGKFETEGAEKKAVHHNLRSEILARLQPAGMLILGIMLVISVCGVAGRLARTAGQPAVVGEMAAGIFLGPSFLGHIAPGFCSAVFSPEHLLQLQSLSHLGVMLFIFIAGMDMRSDWTRNRAVSSLFISHMGIVFPFLLGVGLAFLLYKDYSISRFPQMAMFLGIAMSITAFPVLVRIIKEHGLEGSWLGNLAITCAALDDVSAWSILAIVVAWANAESMGPVLISILLLLLFIAFIKGFAGPLIERLLGRKGGGGAEVGKGGMIFILGFMLFCALFTELVGVHYIFGAFVAGTAFARLHAIKDSLSQRVGHFATSFLVPFFFVTTGLSTRIELLDGLKDWLACAAVIATAVAGKFGGTFLSARLLGIESRIAASLGALMNTRGLMELIVINLGRDLGIISEKMFAMLVLMALATTAMTAPLLRVFKGRECTFPDPGERLKNSRGVASPAPATSA